MSEQKNPLVCDMCGMVIEQDIHQLEVDGKTLHFCCEGCKGMYETLHHVREPAGSSQPGQKT